MNSNGAKRVLIAPLDWGLGHTTRCVLLIGWLRENGHEVVFAGNEWQRNFVKETYAGNIHCVHLEGYNVHYGKPDSSFMFSLLRQMPTLLKTIRNEHKWLKEIVRTENIDGIISDNRYGMYHSHVPSVIMTHQLQVQTGMGKGADTMLRPLHYRYLNRFAECWVVDMPGENNLAGKLSAPSILPQHTAYIGLLSQFEAVLKEEQHLLILLSGPEPQRTILSNILWEQVKNYDGNVVFVEGSNNVQSHRTTLSPHISHHHQLTRKSLLPLLQQASMVVCRSGYSTIMDLVKLGKNAILIPTPGQTEQQYLAKHLHQSGTFYHLPQPHINLQAALTDAASFPFRKTTFHNGFNLYPPVLQRWVAAL
ncbi:MAG TPA: glycosyltransferase [Flavipsychrobacter sp.]|nr:glycosyltransferase [Flavipsychrobacter sp.]